MKIHILFQATASQSSTRSMLPWVTLATQFRHTLTHGTVVEAAPAISPLTVFSRAVSQHRSNVTLDE